ncbi:MAG: hypothetical protein WC944_10200 [Candidatus Cloacimonadaceae bacterium]|jgi:hypothetical protein|nr:hypothetical protein [Candidatus Cloacimonadota bacterium]MCK9243597.1 hypothetical protein [Candidatus Cloacimonadota bacterium]
MQLNMLFILLLVLALGAISNLGAQFPATIKADTLVNPDTGEPDSDSTFYKNFHQQFLLYISNFQGCGWETGNINSFAFGAHALSPCS